MCGNTQLMSNEHWNPCVLCACARQTIETALCKNTHLLQPARVGNRAQDTALPWQLCVANICNKLSISTSNSLCGCTRASSLMPMRPDKRRTRANTRTHAKIQSALVTQGTGTCGTARSSSHSLSMQTAKQTTVEHVYAPATAGACLCHWKWDPLQASSSRHKLSHLQVSHAPHQQ